MPDMSAFAPGQAWTYRGALVEHSRVVVGATDRLELPGSPTVVSISVNDAWPVNAGLGVIEQKAIYHCPIAAETLAECVIAGDGVGKTADGFDEGYARWRQGLERGEGGFFTIPVSEIVELYRNLLAPEQSVT